MCIICNCPNNEEKADRFLSAFDASRSAMRAAAEAMLEISKIAAPQYRGQYDSVHKKMVSQIRAWNALEQEREDHAHEQAAREKP